MRVYFSATFLRSYFQAPDPVRQAFKAWLPDWMNQSDPWTDGQPFTGEYSAYYPWPVTRTWDVVLHRHQLDDLIVFDVIIQHARVYPLPRN